MVVAIVATLALGLIALWIAKRFAVETKRSLSPVLVLSISVVQLVIYTITFAVAFGFGDANIQAPWPLVALLAVLSAPLMYLMYLGPEVFGGRWWGDDSNLILGLAVLNALVWGFAFGWLVERVRRRHAA
jgi:hypothetical protein